MITMCPEPTVPSVAGEGSGAGTGPPVWGTSSEDNKFHKIHLCFRTFINVDNIDFCLSEAEHKTSLNF